MNEVFFHSVPQQPPVPGGAAIQNTEGVNRLVALYFKPVILNKQPSWNYLWH